MSGFCGRPPHDAPREADPRGGVVTDAYYNEIEPYCAGWLQNLMGGGTSPRGGSTPGASATSDQQMLPMPHVPTSLPESQGGTLRCDGPDGRQIAPYGPAPALASRFQRPANAEELRTNDISGLFGFGSSPSVALQQSLESRLLHRMAGYGSPEYALTWRERDMPSGPPICQLRASARYIEGRGYGGLPTPTECDHKGSGRPRKNRGPGNNLRDWFRQKHGFLYPPARIVAWLMGFPEEWGNFADTAGRSSRKSRRSSSDA